MKEINFKHIGRKIRETRIYKGMTQEFVANCVNVNTSHISNIENNRAKVSLTTLVNICNTLGVTVDYILSEEYNSPSSALEQMILQELHHCDDETKRKILKIITALQ